MDDLTNMKLPLSRVNLRRVLISLIEGHQQEMLRSGRLARSQLISSTTAYYSCDSVEDLQIDENLGIDSINIVELIRKIDSFFELFKTGSEEFLLLKRRLGDWADVVFAHFSCAHSGDQICFETSGTTASPKRHAHSFRSLLSEISSIRKDIFSSISCRRIICTVPTRHIYGFIWGSLLPSVVKCEVLDTSPFLPGPTKRRVREGDIVVATPHFLRDLFAQENNFPSGVNFVSSGAPVVQIGKLYEHFETSNVNLIDVYGSTETAGIGWRTNPSKPFTTFSDISRHDNILFRDPLKRKSLETQDHIKWTSHEKFHVIGRKDGIVQVAGTNVSLDAVQNHLRSIEDVSDALVRFDGSRLKAFIATDIPESSHIILEKKIRAKLLELRAAERPETFRFGNELPSNSMGKSVDWL